MKTEPILLEYFGLGGIWVRCRDAAHFEKLESFGFRRNKDSKGEFVDACVMSGIPDKAEKAGIVITPSDI